MQELPRDGREGHGPFHSQRGWALAAAWRAKGLADR